ncbi:MAG: bifunctional proline dehydrogenase/L-glutamate gamma-semialdehyde dehydrogenase PutA, partial [Pseudomonadota bacterium]
QQFVLGETISDATRRAQAKVQDGFTYSYDMLGEAALTAADADEFYQSYADAIAKLAPFAVNNDPRLNPGISIKLSALHPRYETPQRGRVMRELTARARLLTRQARAANIGLNIDAEEADRLDLSLDVIEDLLRDPELAGWDGFGVVVQAFGKRCAAVIDWLYALASALDRHIMVRLVKGAYWDTEIKRNQVEGLPGYPVFTRKAATDVAFLCCAGKLLDLRDRIYPQFATHNAHSVAAIQAIGADPATYEFQRLHGMGEGLHDMLVRDSGARCRIYAPVGAHRDLLAYLVRRLLENGANSSFVNQILDPEVPAEDVAADPWDRLAQLENSPVRPAEELFPGRINSRGWDLHDPDTRTEYDARRGPFCEALWDFAGDAPDTVAVTNPTRPRDVVGRVRFRTGADVHEAAAQAQTWDAAPNARCATLRRASDLYEAHAGELCALLHREAGKTAQDAVAELREAVDFLRYYAAEAERTAPAPRGIFGCISPWNFPLAIFTGQVSAALAAGNAVLAKPAETTPLVAQRAVELLHKAGVPPATLMILPGTGTEVGRAIASLPLLAGMAFTGSTATAQVINRTMAAHAQPDAPLIAETGGLNAMVVDSTALPEQAIRDIVASSFQSAGQRCSAARMLYLQKDVERPFLKMLFGAMDELTLGDPWDLDTDVGPTIDAAAADRVRSHLDAARGEGRLLKELHCPDGGHFVAPAVIRVRGIADLKEEVFGPVLHVATYQAEDLDQVVDAINATGYGLTFGMHSRIDDRVDQVTARLNAGNIYVNRNQIGAVVGSQPFGGEGLSGTGPKAGGPHYLTRFALPPEAPGTDAVSGASVDITLVEAALTTMAAPRRPRIDQTTLPGPTGESNQLATYGRGTVLCLGPTAAQAAEQARIARARECAALIVCPRATGTGAIEGWLPRKALTHLDGIDLVALWSDPIDCRAARRALAARPGAIVPLVTQGDLAEHATRERHTCIDTTAAGGNAALLAKVEG